MPFDATLKDLAGAYPADFLAAFDQPPAGKVSLLNVDLSTVTTAADLVAGVGEPLAEVIHVDFQSSAAAWKHADVLVYNSLLYAEYHVPVHSVVILLRPQAAHSNLNGTVNYAARSGRGKMDFGYEVIPLWQRAANDLLAGALGITPLSVLGALPAGVPLPDALASVAQRLIERIDREAAPDQGRRLLTAAFVLTGLRVTRDVARQVFRGVAKMKDSDTYMAIIDEGHEEHAKAVILRLGQKRLGPADDAVKARLNGITDLARLDRIEDRLLEAASWHELLETP
ncbi:MAG TPA: hypothetical protein VFW33_20650 [Gemmataceae bacterium]|nr:hypothetical protein [Gemmataceae bacterium]